MKRLILTAALLAATATASLSNGTGPAPDPARATPEDMATRARTGTAAAADICTVPTSEAPSADATTWPCKNFSK